MGEKYETLAEHMVSEDPDLKLNYFLLGLIRCVPKPLAVTRAADTTALGCRAAP